MFLSLETHTVAAAAAAAWPPYCCSTSGGFDMEKEATHRVPVGRWINYFLQRETKQKLYRHDVTKGFGIQKEGLLRDIAAAANYFTKKNLLENIGRNISYGNYFPIDMNCHVAVGLLAHLRA